MVGNDDIMENHSQNSRLKVDDCEIVVCRGAEVVSRAGSMGFLGNGNDFGNETTKRKTNNPTTCFKNSIETGATGLRCNFVPRFGRLQMLKIG